MVEAPLQYVVSAREYELLRRVIYRGSSSRVDSRSRSALLRPPSAAHDYNASTFRSAVRLYLATKTGLKAWEMVSARLSGRKAAPAITAPKSAMTASSRISLAAASFLFVYRILFGFLTRLRLKLLHEKARQIRQRYPALFAALTSRFTPLVGASLAGLTLGIAPADQLRVTAALYVGSRALELLYSLLAAEGYLKHKPRWLGSWTINAVANGQLLYAFVFHPDCFPKAYSTLILNHSSEYVQQRPAHLSTKVAWPTTDQIVQAVAEMARLRWPPFVSPILHPYTEEPLPPTIDPVILPLTSRAHPAIQNLSCALLHPSNPSCFMTYLQQNIKAFPKMVRYFALYYAAFALLRPMQFIRKPISSLNKLSFQALRTAAAISGAIGTAWGSICLFQILLPRSFLPRFRFFLGGLLGGSLAILDNTSSGHVNTMYAARCSVDSFWQVGVKRGWWKGIRGGDVLLFTAAWTLIGVVSESEGDATADKTQARFIHKLLTGKADLGLRSPEPEEPGTQSAVEAAPKND